MSQYSGHAEWRSVAVNRRCRIVANVAAKIAEAADDLTRLCSSDQRIDPVETISAELLPLCGALRFIGRRGARILRPARYGVIGRPIWLWGVHSMVRRDPRGTVLILGTWNYPLFLAGVQAAQALAAGNSVQLKPAIGCEAVSRRMVSAFHEAGVPESQLVQLDSSTESAIAAIDAGVDLIVLTGAAKTGQQVLQRAARSLTPTIMELSGCDAVVLMPGADLDRAVDAIVFGLSFNGGATCIGPRRLLIEDSSADEVLQLLAMRLGEAGAVTVHQNGRQAVADQIEAALRDGAVDRLHHFDAARLRSSGQLRPLVLDNVRPSDAIAAADLFAPVISILRVDQIHQAVEIVNQCPYRLAASVFGPHDSALEFASRLHVGAVTVNDLIVPTADPRLPFGGRGRSGFGVTRGGEGLLAMTVPTVISFRRGRSAPHLTPRQSSDAETLLGVLQLLHGRSLVDRAVALRSIFAAHRRSSTSLHQDHHS